MASQLPAGPLHPFQGPSPTPFQQASASRFTHLICFDIDGTILKGGGGVESGREVNRAQHDSFRVALKEVWGVDGGLEDIEHAGMTDRWILRDLHALTKCTLPVEEAIDAAACRMESYVAECGNVGEGLYVLPGIAALLEALHASEKVVLGLVTGNLQSIAWGKIKAVGLDKYFVTGGFGSDGEDRGQLIKVAQARAAAALPTLPPAHTLQCFHIGDTPRDLEAAVNAGVRGVGTATGKFSLEELSTAFPGLTIVPGFGGEGAVDRAVKVLFGVGVGVGVK